MVATSVAARGLDVPQVRLVVNYDSPAFMEDYVHKVGRTGRAGIPGTAWTLITPEEESNAKGIVSALKSSGQSVPPELLNLSKNFEEKRKSGQTVFRTDGYSNAKGHQFNDEEARKKAHEKKLLRIANGIYSEDDDETDFEIIEKSLPSSNSSVSHDTPTTSSPSRTNTNTNANSEAAAPSTNSSNNNNTQPPASDSSPKTESNFVKIVRSPKEVQERLTSLLKEFGAKAEKEAEMEINDFTPQVRGRLLQKETVDMILELTGCLTTPRGSFCPAGKNPPVGQRKLYIAITGPSPQAIQSAKDELRRIVSDVLSKTQPTASTVVGHYKL